MGLGHESLVTAEWGGRRLGRDCLSFLRWYRVGQLLLSFKLSLSLLCVYACACVCMRVYALCNLVRLGADIGRLQV